MNPNGMTRPAMYSEQLSDLSGSDGEEELPMPPPPDAAGKNWQQQVLLNAQRNLGGPFRTDGNGQGGGSQPGDGMPETKEFDPRSLEVWNKFFENAATLNQVNNGGTVNGLRVYRVPQVAGFEWPDLPSERKFHKVIKTTVAQPECMIRNINLATSLLYATMLGDNETMSMLLELGADPNSSDGQQRSPAHYASKLNDTEMLNGLVEYGAELESPDATGRNPLHIATVYGSLDAARYLLESAVAADALDKEGNTSLHLVCHCGIKALEISKLLLEYGADLSIKNDCGMTPRNYAEAVYEISRSKDLRELSDLFRERSAILGIGDGREKENEGEGEGDAAEGDGGAQGLVQGIFSLTLTTAGNLIAFATDMLSADADGSGEGEGEGTGKGKAAGAIADPNLPPPPPQQQQRR
jgi:ankyrin repeat protein